MKRFFTSDSESDMLIAVAANFYDLKTEELINMAIKNEFLPVTEPFRTEAAYILQRKAEGQLNDWEIKQCMSRGVRALGLRPIRNEENLKEFFARYHLSDVVSDSSITENDTLGKATVEIYTILDKELPADNIDGTYLLETIFANWDSLCKQAADDALKLFAANEKIKNALRKSASYEQSISPATLETNSVYIYIPDEKLIIYGDLLRIITAQSMEYFSSRPPEHKKMILFCLDEFASFGKLQITEALRKLRKRHIRIMVLTQSLADLDMIYGKDERKAMLGNFKFTVILGCKDTETQEYFSKMIGEKRSLLATDPNQKPQPIIKPADLAHLEQDLFVVCDDGAVRLRKNFYFK